MLIPSVGMIVDLYGCRAVVLCVTPAFSAVLVGLSCVPPETPALLCVLLSLLWFLGPECMVLIANTTTSRWFNRHRGKATSILGIGLSIQPLVPTVLQQLIDHVPMLACCCVLSGDISAAEPAGGISGPEVAVAYLSPVHDVADQPFPSSTQAPTLAASEIEIAAISEPEVAVADLSHAHGSMPYRLLLRRAPVWHHGRGALREAPAASPYVAPWSRCTAASPCVAPSISRRSNTALCIGEERFRDAMYKRMFCGQGVLLEYSFSSGLSLNW